MIGELVTELKQVQLYEDTTVIFWTCALTLALHVVALCCYLPHLGPDGCCSATMGTSWVNIVTGLSTTTTRTARGS